MGILGRDDENWSSGLEWVDVLATRVADAYLAWRARPTDQTKQALENAANEYRDRKP